MAQEIWKTSILYPKVSNEFYHDIKFRKSIMNGMCSTLKAVLKYFATFTRKHPCWCLFLIKIIKNNLQPKCFPVNMARVLRVSILQNICERLFECFPTGTNNTVVTSHIGSE